jgi:FkbM family methyltransferase
MSRLFRKLFTLQFWLLGLNDPRIAMNKNSVKLSYLRKFKSKSSWTLVDLGSHRGEFADRATNHLKIDKYIFVDPNSDYNKVLSSKYPGSTILNYGVSTSDLPLNYIRNTRNPGQNFTSANIKSNEKVESISLTKLFDMYVNSDSNIFLKIDIEGDEVAVLKSLSLEIASKLDIISLEITPISNSKNFLIELDQFLPKSFDFYRERRLGWVPIDRSNPHWTDHLGVFQNLILVNRH